MTELKERHKKMNSLYDFAFGVSESIGEKPKQVQADPIVIKGDDLKPAKILDRSRFDDDFNKVFGV